MKLDFATDGRRIVRFSGGMQMRLENLLTGMGLVVVALLMIALSSGVGTAQAGAGDVLKSLLGVSITDEQAYALWTVRLPRIAIGFLAGWSVALAGAMLQSIARNPLADPGLFGLSQGSMTMIMLLLVLVPTASKVTIAFAAVGGGLAVGGLLVWLSGGERTSGLAILLLGIAIESVLSSFATLLLLYTPAETSYALSDWMAGSLFQANWRDIGYFLPLFLASLVGIFWVGRALAVYDLGVDLAMSLGEPVGRSRPLILGFAVLLSSAAVTAVGPLTFLGVLAPHLAGFISPAVGRARLYLSALMGGILVIGADTLARASLGNVPLPIGLSLTLIGVPLFIFALRLQGLRKRHLH